MRSLLWLPYAANIVILVPVVWSMLASGGTDGVFEGKVANSDGLRLLVGALWLAILVCSVAGLFAPLVMTPLLAVQVIYKATWLALFVLPVWRVGGWDAVPSGITTVFVGIVLVWPFLVWIAWRAGAAGG